MSDFEKVLQCLRNLGMFHDIPEEALHGLADVSKIVHHKDGSVIIMEGTESDGVFYLISGKVDILKGSSIIHQMEAPIIFGEFSVLSNPQKRTASVIARTQCESVFIPADLFREVMNHHPKAYAEIVSQLVNRLNESSSRVLSQSRIIKVANERIGLLNDSLIKILSMVMTYRDLETFEHCERVVRYTENIAKAMGVNEAELEILRMGALFHDIGKIGIPDRILLKDKQLTPFERNIIESHTIIGFKIISEVQNLQDVAPIVRSHHERWDGGGYPDGLHADSIPIGARIFAIVDSFDAMTTDRPYSKGRPSEEAMWELVNCRTKNFDPEIIDLVIDNTDLLVINSLHHHPPTWQL